MCHKSLVLVGITVITVAHCVIVIMPESVCVFKKMRTDQTELVCLGRHCVYAMLIMLCTKPPN